MRSACKAKRLRSSFVAVFLTELIDTTCGVHNFLCAGVERMAFRTYFDVQNRFADHRLGLKAIAATAGNSDFLVIWVYVLFHFSFLTKGFVRLVYALGCFTKARIIHKYSDLRKFIWERKKPAYAGFLRVLRDYLARPNTN